jgi:Uma2 family endonuclease
LLEPEKGTIAEHWHTFGQTEDFEMTPTTLLEPVATWIPPSNGVEDALYEVVKGQRVELPPMSAYATRIASELHGRLFIFAQSQELGISVMEMLFALPLPDRQNRRPDVAFVSYQRWAKGLPIPEADNAWDVVPDLAIEVMSLTNLAEDLMEHLVEYFQAGVRLVWVVYPRQRLVYVYESLTHIRGLTRNEELDGGAVLPGFRLALASVFPEAVASA